MKSLILMGFVMITALAACGGGPPEDEPAISDSSGSPPSAKADQEAAESAQTQDPANLSAEPTVAGNSPALPTALPDDDPPIADDASTQTLPGEGGSKG